VPTVTVFLKNSQCWVPTVTVFF